jgi:hypothetical protein
MRPTTMTTAGRFVDCDRVGVGATGEPGTIIDGERRGDGSWVYRVAMDAGYVYTGPPSVLDLLDDEEES